MPGIDSEIRGGIISLVICVGGLVDFLHRRRLLKTVREVASGQKGEWGGRRPIETAAVDRQATGSRVAGEMIGNSLSRRGIFVELDTPRHGIGDRFDRGNVMDVGTKGNLVIPTFEFIAPEAVFVFVVAVIRGHLERFKRQGDVIGFTRG